MKNIDERTQLLAIEKILEEMQQTEKNLLNWKAYWYERYDNIVVPTEYLNSPYDSPDNVGREKYYGVNWYKATDEALGLPIKTMKLDNGCSYDICTINWKEIKTNRTIRNISFNNNGDIIFSKKHSQKHSKAIKYEARFNVLSNDFDISIKILTLNTKKVIVNCDNLSLALTGNTITKKYNDIEIVDNLTIGKKQVKIIKEYERKSSNNASVLFEATLDNTNALEKGSVEINTHKGNGKVNGTYRISASEQQGVKANFYSRKGVNIDLTANPLLFNTSNRLMLTSDKTLSNNMNSNMIITSFTNSTETTLRNGLANKVISFDSSEFNMETVTMVEKKITEMIKSIKGEIPVEGLVTRINDYLEIIKASSIVNNNDKEKVLRLVPVNENNKTTD